jgi:threonine dehydrogenase-like Zn-dependent dehydrogenase
VKALTWEGVNELVVTQVPDPQILNRQDAILKVNLSSVCGSDLHQLSGYVPFMRAGDVIGHEFMGEIVEVGPDVRRRRVGERVVVCSVIACGRCWFCEQGLFSLCDNGNTNPAITETMWGATTRPASLATPTPWAASRAVTPSTSGCPMPTTSPSRSLTGSTT